MSCLFCKLKDVKDNIIYENDYVYVILDRFPISNRHFLIITKEHREVLHKCEAEILSNMITIAKFLADKFKMEKYNILQNNVNGQLIMHCHLHVIEANNSGRLNVDEHSKISLNDEEYSKLVKDTKTKMNN